MQGRFSLSELQIIIRDSLYLALPDSYWVIGEISELKQNYSGHCYLELIEKQTDETKIKARIRAVIWGSRYGFIKSFFENATGELLREGLKVLVKGKIEYHELYGLSLVITDIDPSFTLGEMAARRMQIIKRLEEEGVFGMNRELEIPLVPQRIAIISSRTAAGYSDFLDQLLKNSYGYVFYTALFEAVMQGSETEQSIINAMNKIATNAELFDVVVIIRGGGSQTDLSWFDNYSIAFYVTQFPLPVITGIGHEKDLSVTDMVACKPLKTPTAVASFLIECINTTEIHLLEMGTDIKDMTLSVLDEFKERIDRSKNILAPLSRIMISDFRRSLSGLSLEMLNLGKGSIHKAGLLIAGHKSELQSASKLSNSNNDLYIKRLQSGLISKSEELIRRHKEKVLSMGNSLNILNPENILKRGYTITSFKGRILKNSEQLSIDDNIETQFSDGKITSRVTGRNNKT